MTRTPPLIAFAVLVVLLPAAAAAAPARILFDTDIGPDCDDAGTMAVLHALADRGEAVVLGMACCTSSEWGAPCLDAINTWYGRPDVPVGTCRTKTGFLCGGGDHKYNEHVAKHFPNALKSGAGAPDAVALYRKLLAAQPDGSVTVVATGPLPNLAALLDSRPDAASPLDGVALVKKKARLLVVMGGRYPAGKEWNFEPVELGPDGDVVRDPGRSGAFQAVARGDDRGGVQRKERLDGRARRPAPLPHQGGARRGDREGDRRPDGAGAATATLGILRPARGAPPRGRPGTRLSLTLRPTG